LASNVDDDLIDQYKRELIEKFNEALRKEGFSEDQIAKLDTVVRRALDL
jgi:hypothetical protein